MHEPAFRVGLRSYAIIGTICIIFFGGASIGAFVSRQYPPIAIFALFFALGAGLVASAGTFEFNQEHIAYQSAYGRFRMNWADVRAIEFSAMGTLVLHGAGQRFVIFPASYWSGVQKREAAAFLDKMIKESGRVPTLSRIADYRLFKNVRVRA